MNLCHNCKHEKQWHTSGYGCLWHPKGTELLEYVCACNIQKEEIEK